MTALDTSSNYLGFGSHRALAGAGSDLLSRFSVSTKVGYFPGRDGAQHSLDPSWLYAAVEQAASELGREPDLVFLHNPEHSLRNGSLRDRDVLSQACAALDNAAASGVCAAWGVASWDPSSLLALIDPATPKPSVLMVRAGLLVGMETLDAADALVEAWAMDAASVWGMSPFGGSADASVWSRADPRVFLRDRGRLTRVQAAFRAAYHLPRVGSVTVGTNEPTHLGELVDALVGEVDEGAVRKYRRLLRDHSCGQPA